MSTSAYICILRPTRADMLRTGPTEREADLIGRHFQYLQDLCLRGVVVLAGRTTTQDEHTFGICVFRAPSPAHAQSIVEADPVITGGVMSAALHPFRVALLTSLPPACAAPLST